MPSTVQEFVNSTLRLIRVLDSGETPTATESNDALVALNQLISSWSAAGVPIYFISRDQIPLTGAQTYTLTQRPLRIRAADIAVAGIALNLKLITAEEWAAIIDKTQAGKFAQSLFYDGAFPNPTIYLWPTPAPGGVLEIWSIKPLTGFASLADTIDLPPGYEQGLRYNLGMVLAPEYGSALPPEVAAVAAESKAAIAALNAAAIGPSLPVAPAA